MKVIKFNFTLCPCHVNVILLNIHIKINLNQKGYLYLNLNELKRTLCIIAFDWRDFVHETLRGVEWHVVGFLPRLLVIPDLDPQLVEHHTGFRWQHTSNLTASRAWCLWSEDSSGWSLNYWTSWSWHQAPPLWTFLGSILQLESQVNMKLTTILRIKITWRSLRATNICLGWYYEILYQLMS